ncbi:HNH endonuclease [Euphorbia peplus]|nr:HNH endonuclease [Euphorbia peplus]
MAHLTAQGRLKLLFNCNGVQCKLLGKDFAGGSRSRSRSFQLLQRAKLSSRLFLRKKSNADDATLSFKDETDTDDEDDYDDYDSEAEDDNLACFRGLVLDISYRPVNVVCWKRAICLEFMEKADVLEYYDQAVNSPSGSFYIPAVLRVPHLLQVVKRRRVNSNLSRKNIMFRDHFTCQYCSSRENLTIDHVLPSAKGGKWTWENLVTACSKCNSKKGQKTVEEANMKLLKVPKAPKEYDILAIPLTSAAIRMLRVRKGMPEEWRQYLSNSYSEAP